MRPAPSFSQQHAQSDPSQQRDLGVGSSAQAAPTSYTTIPTGGVGFANEEDEEDEDACRYQLEIVQQPIRARMCGFGDRDRRPLTPPLIVKVRAFSKATGREVPAEDLDIHFFVLQADLWSSDKQHEVNLVQHAQSTARGSSDSQLARPSGSEEQSPSFVAGGSGVFSSRARSYSGGAGGDPFAFGMTSTQTQQGQFQPSTQVGLPGAAPASWGAFTRSPPGSGQTGSIGSSTNTSPQDPGTRDFFDPSGLAGSAGSSTDPAFYGQAPQAGLATRLPPMGGFTTSPEVMQTSVLPPSTGRRPSTSQSRSGLVPGVSPSLSVAGRPAPPLRAPTGEDYGAAFGAASRMAPTGNLVGNHHNNAHKLKDPQGTLGVYFVFHDLSIRTEGTFCLRLTFVVLGQGSSAATTAVNAQDRLFSDNFEVFSAKKFPGMIAATELSQCFASQGLRIPTRKGPQKRKRDDAAADGGDDQKDDEGDSDDQEEQEEQEEAG